MLQPRRLALTLALGLPVITGCGGDVATSDGGRDATSDVCSEDVECADDVFCNGVERCAPGAAGSDARGCAPAESMPCLASQTCDEADDRCRSDCDEDPDADDDGHDSTDCGGDDCDDADADRFPGNPEVCDAAGHDEDCNPTSLGPDGDSDGFVSTACCNTQAGGALLCGDDCNDANGEVNPEATEVCNGVDENCNGVLDGPNEDDDGDGFPDACAGLPAAETDCDDEDPGVHPGAAELCDGRDNDCDGSPIAGDDLDGDGYAAASSACVEAAGTLPKTDCDDGNDAVHPGATDTCNGADDDCNGTDDDPATADASCNPTARGTSICADGACEVTSCDTGYDDCDSSASNGCEITLATDAAHCGACGSACGVGGYCRASVCRPAHVRSLRFGGVGADTVSAIAVDASGNLYITGAIEGTVNFGGSDLTSASGASIFVASFTPAGAHRWSAAYGGGGLSRGEDIAVDASGNVYVTGQLFGTANFGGGNRASAGEDDVFVASFTSAGAHRWSQRYGSTGSDRGAGLTVSGANVVVTGSFSDTVDFGGPFARVSNGSLDVFVIAYTTGAGAHAWSAAFGGAAMDLGEAIASDATGNVYVTGRGNGEMILYQFTSSGSLGWYDRYGPSGNATGADIAVDGSTLYVVGSFQSTLDLGGGVATSAGSFDVFVASYAAADGAHRWSNTYGGTSVDRAFGVALFSSQPVVAGMFGAAVDFGGGTLTSLGGLDSFVGGYQSSGGAHDWSRRDGASGSDVAADVGVSGSSVWVAGTFSGTVDFGGGGRVSAGGTDIFLLELAP